MEKYDVEPKLKYYLYIYFFFICDNFAIIIKCWEGQVMYFLKLK